MAQHSIFQPRNPTFREKITDSFQRQGFMGLLQARLVSVDAGRVVIDLPWRQALTQQQGVIHGGAVGAIADSAAGYAALTLMAPGVEVVTVEYKINFLKGAAGPLIRATGEVQRAGKTLTIVTASVVGGLNLDGSGQGQPVALMQATMMAVNG
jgi:uncharacterized protein (TIGR00369 family)